MEITRRLMNREGRDEEGEEEEKLRKTKCGDGETEEMKRKKYKINIEEKENGERIIILLEEMLPFKIHIKRKENTTHAKGE